MAADPIALARDLVRCPSVTPADGGALGVIDNCRQASYGYDQRAEVFGSEGAVMVGNDGLDRTTLVTADGARGANPKPWFQDRYADAYAAEMQAFVDADLRRACPGRHRAGRAALCAGEPSRGRLIGGTGPVGRRSGVEVGEHGQHAAVVVLGRRQAELAEDAVAVLADRLLGDEQPAGDGGVAASFGHQPEDRALAGGELAERLVAGGASSGFTRPPMMTSSRNRVGSPNTTTSTKGTPSSGAASAWPPSWTQAWMSLPCA